MELLAVWGRVSSLARRVSLCAPVVVLAVYSLPAADAGERITNGGFGSSTGWTNWTERGSVTRDFNSSAGGPAGGSAPHLRFHSGSNFNGGVWQQITLVGGQTYTLSGVFRDYGGSDTWAEVLIGTTPPVNGADYTNGNPSGTVLLIKSDTWSCDNWNHAFSSACVSRTTSYVCSGTGTQTRYICLKVGIGGSVDTTFDSVSLIGPDPCIPPNAPTAGTSTATSATQITWGWTKPSGTGITYKGYDAASGGTLKWTSAADAASHVEGGLTPNTQYQRWVSSYLNCESATRCACPALYTLANVPGAPTVSDAQPTSLKVAASATGETPSNPSATQYAITITGGAFGSTEGVYYVPAAGGTPTQTVAWQAKSSWTAKTVTGLANGTTYTFKVKAKNGNNVETAFGAPATGTTSACVPPTAPNTPGATGITSSAITWTWVDASNNETGFKVYADPGAGTPTTLRTTTAANATSWNGYTGLGANTQHSFQVASTNGTCDSAKTANFTAWTLANTPNAPTVTNVRPTIADVSITSGDGNPATTQYAVQFGTQWVQPDGTLGATAAWQTAAQWGTLTVTGLSPSTTYAVSAKARNGATTPVETALSSATSITTTRAVNLLTGTYDPEQFGGTSAPAGWSQANSNVNALWTYNDQTMPCRSGYDLKMSASTNQYQGGSMCVRSIINGLQSHSYTLECSWKGDHTGSTSWFELLVGRGSSFNWDAPAAADMIKKYENTSFACETRSGSRARSSTNNVTEQLTVALKCGTYISSSVTAYFDKVFLWDDGRVVGRVLSGGSPVSGATVTMTLNGQPNQTTTTGPDGYWEIDHAPVANGWTVTASKTGYCPAAYNGTMNVTGTSVVDCGDVTLSACTAPTITLQPVSQSVCAGTDATFLVAASDGCLSYQWYSGAPPNGTLIPGATSPSYVTGTAGSYYCVASNPCGSAISNAATLTVNPLPIAPTGASASPESYCQGATGDLTLTATGGSGDTLRWYSGSCGGTLVGTGTPLSISKPTETTTYYARWETAACGVSGCVSVTVTVTPDTDAPTTTASSPANANAAIPVGWTAADVGCNGQIQAGSVKLYARASTGSWADSGLAGQSGTSGTFSYTPTSDGLYYFQVVATDGLGNAMTPPSGETGTGQCSTTYDTQSPTVSITAVTQDGQDLLSGTHAVQGDGDRAVRIAVSATDANGIAGEPGVTVTPNGGSPEPAVFLEGTTFDYTWTVTSATPNGDAEITATVTDAAGNSASVSKTIVVNKNQISGTLNFDTLSNGTYSFDRVVRFVAASASGSVLATWDQTLSFTNREGVAFATFVLADVPDGTVRLAAKTAWSLRRRIDISLNSYGQASVDALSVLGGDLNGSNSINVLDYTMLKSRWFTTDPVADINGDGEVQTLDYLIMKANWFGIGDELD